jgi:hypothetical protein
VTETVTLLGNEAPKRGLLRLRVDRHQTDEREGDEEGELEGGPTERVEPTTAVSGNRGETVIHLLVALLLLVQSGVRSDLTEDGGEDEREVLDRVDTADALAHEVLLEVVREAVPP